jgi:hypothetical protein
MTLEIASLLGDDNIIQQHLERSLCVRVWFWGLARPIYPGEQRTASSEQRTANSAQR